MDRDGYELVRPGKGTPARQILDALITTRSAVNAAVRFLYTIQLGYWNMTSSPATGGVWVPKPSGKTFSAFSSAEDMNTFVTTTGAIGTGNTNVTRADGTVNGGSCKFLPLPIGGYCQVIERGRDTAGNRYYTIVNFANSAQ